MRNQLVPALAPRPFGELRVVSVTTIAHARGQFGQFRTRELRNSARICNPSILRECNYRLDVVVKGSGSARKARVVVFKDLKSHYKLTSWEWLNQ